MSHRILVTGSRNWTSVSSMRRMLAVARACYPDAVLVHGACRGADLMAAGIWTGWGLPTEAHPADWDRHGKAAGPIRNQHMIRLGADACVAFLRPESKGARHCADAAERAGIATYRVNHKGT
ncbi:DUF2493 domain-containing protein [Lentzea californiensis]|uniref:DUF2493 domain-containing protein n=1 Tax=Lentzea californiensis TaxID=438851 RepID=UPI002164ED66|nr:DUF2493 domain-containing protein [Lentzea californiensis]MCR3746666.1 Protein of unknown function (DUF2493) [Lentzea californiensis]